MMLGPLLQDYSNFGNYYLVYYLVQLQLRVKNQCSNRTGENAIKVNIGYW